MRLLFALAALYVLPATSFMASAQSTGTCATPPSMQLSSGSLLAIHSRSGEIDVVGTDQEGLRVSCKLDHADDMAKIRLSFSQEGSTSLLRLTGGPQNNVRIRIEVPARTNLKVHVPAGDLNISQIIGNKEIHLTAGEISVSPVSREEYGSVKASTRIGDVNVPGRDVSKGGFFRSFSDSPGPGRYYLNAHLTVGDITLK